MITSSIADAKNNLSQLLHQIEIGETIHLTRYGKPVAVIISELQYQNLIAPNKSLNAAIVHWHNQIDKEMDYGFDDSELAQLRKDSAGRQFSWEK